MPTCSIALTAMSELDFQTYYSHAIQAYAEENIQAGNWSRAEALERSKKEFEGYLPQGVQTPGQHIFTLVNEENEKVGFLWYGIPPKHPEEAYLYDFEIYPEYRRRGYATQALAALEQIVKNRGLTIISLHVFGHNTAARELYRKAGFTETNVGMAKKVT